MSVSSEAERCFVLKPDELPALNYLPKTHPRPLGLVWINRGTNQELRPTTIHMLLRTLFRESASPSITRLHRTSGLRIVFGSVADREKFSRMFQEANLILLRRQRSEVTAVFDKPSEAEHCFRELVKIGVSPQSISLLWRAGQFLEANHRSPRGHSRTSIAAASAGAGLVGAIVGITLLTLPGLGPIAIGGAIAANAIGTVGAVGGALGASAGGIARMLSDIDVDDREVPYFVMQIKSGKVFISVDPKVCGVPPDQVSDVLRQCKGHFGIAALD